MIYISLILMLCTLVLLYFGHRFYGRLKYIIYDLANKISADYDRNRGMLLQANYCDSWKIFP
jgi:hypothetical protein